MLPAASSKRSKNSRPLGARTCDRRGMASMLPDLADERRERPVNKSSNRPRKRPKRPLPLSPWGRERPRAPRLLLGRRPAAGRRPYDCGWLGWSGVSGVVLSGAFTTTFLIVGAGEL